MRSTDYLKKNGVDVEASLDIFGDIETYNSSVGEFVVGVTEKLNQMNSYKISKDMNNYAIYAHSLKSDANFFGFTKLGELATEMEEKAKSGDMYYVNENFPKLQEEINKSIEVVKEYMNGTDGAPEAPAAPAAPVEEEKTAEPAPVETAPAEDIATPVEVAPAPVEEKKEEVPNNAVVYDKKTILVVDDSNIIRNFVKRVFSEEYEVGTAQNGQEAIDILKANKDNEFIETILLDLNMPKVDGFAVLDFMQENNLLTKFPVSIISGDSSKETIDRAFGYQIIDMLSKPFNEASVKSVIEKTIMFKGME